MLIPQPDLSGIESASTHNHAANSPFWLVGIRSAEAARMKPPGVLLQDKFPCQPWYIGRSLVEEVGKDLGCWLFLTPEPLSTCPTHRLRDRRTTISDILFLHTLIPGKSIKRSTDSIYLLI